MNLETEHGGRIQNPSIQQVMQALQDLNPDGNSFAILSRSETDYIQTSVSSERGFVLEYREEEPGGHFRADDPSIGLPEIQEAFLAWSRGGTDWRTSFSWAPLEKPLASSSGGCFSLLVATLIIGVALFAGAAFNL
jgi:hypothetical protein